MSKNRTKATETAKQNIKNMTAEQIAEMTKEVIAETATEQTAETEQTKELQLPTAKDFAEFKAVAKSFVIRELHFHVAVDKVTDIKSADGEGTDNSVRIGQYGVGSNGKGELVSVWCRRNESNRKATLLSADGTTRKETHKFPRDFGVRFSKDDFKMFSDVADCQTIINSAYNEHTEIKHNEPRFSFDTLSAVTEFLATLYTAYETATAETKETAETATATA